MKSQTKINMEKIGNMYNVGKSKSYFQKVIAVFLQLISLCIVVWMFYFNGYKLLYKIIDLEAVNIGKRQLFIIFCIVVYLIRSSITLFVFLKRKVSLGEALTIGFFIFFINVVFGIITLTTKEVDWVTYFGLIIFIVGSFFHNRAEFLRFKWKKNPLHKGKLYTEGLFKYSMHINYFFDTVAFTGFAVITGSYWTFLLPIIMIFGFVKVNIPMLDKYLSEKYPEEFQEYVKKTKKFIPFIY